MIDGHLDLAYNVLKGRDYQKTALEQRKIEQRSDQEVMVSLPDLLRGEVRIVFATLFTKPANVKSISANLLASGPADYDNPAEAKEAALKQLAVYENWQNEGLARIITDRQSLEDHLALWPEDQRLGLVILMENADPIQNPAELPFWWQKGVRIIGPAWRGTRYCGGTGEPGPLTELGRELISQMSDLGFILDISHMAEESFWQAMALNPKRVIASHSNARTITPTDRHLSDEMIKTIGQKEGVIGLVLANPFLEPRSIEDQSIKVTLEHVKNHAEHIANLIGWDKVAIGSDFDGGFGLQETPEEFETVADLRKIASILPENALNEVLDKNWLRYLRNNLP